MKLKRKLVATLVALVALALIVPIGAWASSAKPLVVPMPVMVQPAMACALLTSPTKMVRGLISFKLDATLYKFNLAKSQVLSIDTRWASRPTCTKPGVVIKSVGFKHMGMSVTSAIDKAILARTSPSAQTFLFAYRNDNLAKKAIYIGKMKEDGTGTSPDIKPVATALCSLIVVQGSGAIVSG